MGSEGGGVGLIGVARIGFVGVGAIGRSSISIDVVTRGTVSLRLAAMRAWRSS